jgi:pilus assembly protein CpaE
MRDGKVLAFIACKGGSGATFIATNFGYALATLADKKVLLIDLHRQFGDATLYVSDQKPAMTLSDVCQQIARIDGPFLDSCLVHVAPGFGVLAAADDPARRSRPSPSTSTRSCAWRASTTTTSCSTSGARSTPSRCARSTAPTPSIRCCSWRCRTSATRAACSTSSVRSATGTDNIRLIVNRYEKGGRCACRTCTRARREVLHTVPNDYVAVTDSVNQGMPVLQAGARQRRARSLAELVEVMTARRVAETKGLFDRLFGRGEGDD